MQEKLEHFINEIRATKGLSSYEEATTKQVIIIRILDILGWNIFDVKDIQPEYPVDKQNSNEKVDYSLAKDTDNMVFVEAKGVSVDLEDWEEKFCNYCFKNNVVIGVLTNGISWWFYLPRAKGSWYERKFYSINLFEQDVGTVVSKFIDFLTKQNVTNGKAEENAKKTYESKQKNEIIKKSLPQAWNKLISSGDESFIDFLNNMLEKVSGYRAESEEIAEFLEKNRKELSIPETQAAGISRRPKEVESYSPLEKDRVAAYVRTGFTGKAISAYIFNNKKYEVESWKQLLLGVCDEMNDLHNRDFDKVLSLKGRKRPYFTKNANQLRIPEKIKGTDIFVEVNLSANSIVSLCEDVLSLFGYGKDSLKIVSN